MQLTEIQDRLIQLDNDKLIDMVRNYRQYGYTENIRNFALAVLKRRGISSNDLQFTGNLENKTYNRASDVFSSFKFNTLVAFAAYCIALLIKFLPPYLGMGSTVSNNLIALVFIAALIIYFIFLLRSFLNQTEFYKLTGDEYGSEGALIYLFLGMPFYFVMYFVFRGQMSERLKYVP